ncbi:MAG: Ig-like domain-containing protein [Elusimicrobiota bacterium]
MRKIIITGFLFVLCIGRLSAFDVSVTDLVGEDIGANTNITLPSVIKASSDWIPLYKITITTTTSYTLNITTVTLVRKTTYFDASVDLLALSNGLAFFKDDGNGVWEGSATEYQCSASATPSTWTENPADTWRVMLSLTSNRGITAGDNFFYLAIRTSDSIENGAQFRADYNANGELVLEFSDGTTETGNYGAADTMTADIIAPSFQYSYTPDATDGTTAKVINWASDNVYSQSNDSTINIAVDLGELQTKLDPDSIFALSELFTIDETDYLGAGSVSYPWYADIADGDGNADECWIQYDLSASTVNQNTDGVNPLKFQIRVRDAAGNVSALEDSFNIYIDSKAPEAVALNTPAADAWIGPNNMPTLSWATSTEPHLNQYRLIVTTITDVNYAMTAGGTSRYRYKNLGDVTSAYFPTSWDAGSLSVATSSTTIYYWSIVGIDYGNNITPYTSLSPRSFYYDNETPTISNNLPTTTQTSSVPVITAVFLDNYKSGIDISSFTMLLDGNAVTPSYAQIIPSSYTISYTPNPPLADGSHTVQLQCQDNVGNQSSVTQFSFSIDTKRPVVLDSDNDGWADYDELANNWNPNSNSSPGGTGNDFYPLKNQVVNYDDFVTNNTSKIKITIEDPLSGSVGATSGVDIDNSSITVTGPKGSFSFGNDNIPITDQVSSSNNQCKTSSFTCQLPLPLSNIGADDGTYTITIKPKENTTGLDGDTVTRIFIYDATLPTITPATNPTTGNTSSYITLSLTAADTNGISSAADAVQIVYRLGTGGADTTANMVAGAGGSYSFTAQLTTAGTYYYYFSATDTAKNIAYSPGDDTQPAVAERNMLYIADKTAPQAVISKLETLRGYLTTGLTPSNPPVYTITTSPSIIQTPTVYAAGASTYTLIQATVPVETTTLSFQYRQSPSGSWIDLTTEKTASTTYQTWWQTTGLTVGSYYDIRAIATDAASNTDTPTSNSSFGFITVYIATPPAPKSDIITDNRIDDSARLFGDKVLISATPSASTRNIEYAAVKFQYKRSDTSAWTDIATDTTTDTTPTNVTITLNENDIPYIMDSKGVDITKSITAVKFDCTTDNTYDRSMTKSGNLWSVTIPFAPGTYQYNFDLTFADSTGLANLQDPHEYDDAGGNSQIIVGTFSTMFNISALTSNVSYDFRAVATDSRNNTDASPSYITMIYDNSAPAQPTVTEPVAPANRLKADGATTIAVKAAASDTYGLDVVIFQYSDDSGTTWKQIGSDADLSDGCTVQWQLPNLASDTTYYIRVFAWDTAGNISSASSNYPVILDVTDPTITNFSVVSPSTSTTLTSGTRYTLIAETLDSDIAYITYTHTLSSGTWIPSAIITSKTGSGTISDPYKYTVYFEPTNTETETEETLTATITDFCGRTGTKTLTVNSLDITPSVATLSQVNIDDDGDGSFNKDAVDSVDNDADGLIDEDPTNPVTAGSNIYIGRNGAFLQATVSNLDGGTVKFQYSTSATGPWTTIEEVAAATITTTTNQFIPLAFGLAEGTYYLRALVTDNDGNVDSNPTVISAIYDGTEPTINTFTAPTTTIDCSRPFTLYAKTNNTDVSRIVFQYYDPSPPTPGWVVIDTTTANRLIRLVSSKITPSAVGLAEQTITVTAPNVTQPTSLQVRAFCIDKAGNRNTDTSHAPVSTISLNDTAAPVATIVSAANGTVSAETSEANVKSVLFQYRPSGSSIWMDLGTDTPPPDATFGNTGTRWTSPITLTNLPADTYQLRAIATDMFNNSSVSVAPVLTASVSVNDEGTKTYSLPRSTQIVIGISNVSFTGTGSVQMTVNVISANPLTSAPTVSFFITDGSSNTATKTVALTGATTSWSGTVELTNLATTAGAGNASITVYGTDAAGNVWGDTVGLILSAPANNPTGTSIDNMARLDSYSNWPALANNGCLFIGPAYQPQISTEQSAVIKPIGRVYEFASSDGTKQFLAGITAYCWLDYADADIPSGYTEGKLGVAYWDSVNSKWSSEGITYVSANQTANRVWFTTTHLGRYALMVINSTTTITFRSPVQGGYVGTTPSIDIEAADTFSGIREFKLELDGSDVTAVFGGTTRILSDTSARYTATPTLTPVEHTLKVTVTNQQGQVATSTIKFNSGTLNWTGTQPTNAQILVSTKTLPTIPSTQSFLSSASLSAVDFSFADKTTTFPANSNVQLQINYNDAELTGGTTAETNLGIAWWDSTNSKWSAEGITSVSVDQDKNVITFNTKHTGTFAPMVINSTTTITFHSPVQGGYVGTSPSIDIEASDTFSAIRQFKLELDGSDVTAAFTGTTSILSDTSARYTATPTLTPVEHTLKVTVTNQQGQVATSTIKFNSGTLNWTGTQPTNAQILVSTSPHPSIPSTQSFLKTASSASFDFSFADQTTTFPANSNVQLQINYNDSELTGGTTAETNLGIAWWDSTNSKWSAEGITSVSVDQDKNVITFNTKHTGTFAPMIINSTTTITFRSPVNGGYVGTTPSIDIEAFDTFSAIRQFKLELDGSDVTAAFAGTTSILSDTSARYTATPTLTPQEHTLKVTVTNQQGQVATSTVKFNSGTLAWTGTQPTNAQILVSTSPPPSIPSTQSFLKTASSSSYDFSFMDKTTNFPTGSNVQLQINYNDSELTGGTIAEANLGIAWWDSTNSKWSSEGITSVSVDQDKNVITFRTNHFTIFAPVIIYSTTTVTINSPAENKYASANPLISLSAEDTFSAIREVKVEVDGSDITGLLYQQAAIDGIDNDSDGLVDEQGGDATTFLDDELPFALTGTNAAKFIARALYLNLKDGEHTLKITVTNEQGKSTIKSIKFNTGSTLEMTEPHNYPNPFDPTKIPAYMTAPTYICPNITTDALVKIKIYDFEGHEVASLEERLYNQNEYITWDGKDNETQKYLANGVYFAKIEANSSTQKVKKFIKIAIVR